MRCAKAEFSLGSEYRAKIKDRMRPFGLCANYPFSLIREALFSGAQTFFSGR
jgi:hypothetical protein